jgi:transposase
MKSTQDGRNRTEEQQEIIRQQAVKAVLGGMKQVEAAHVFGVSRVAIFKWLKQVKKKGIQSLDAKKRGGGKEALLKPYQERWIIEKIKDKLPEQLKLELDYVLWTREAIQKLIEKRFKTRIALRTITDYLNKWKMTPQKPVAKAYQQNSQAVEEWKNTEYPPIAKRAKKEKGVIFWGDEMGLRS